MRATLATHLSSSALRPRPRSRPRPRPRLVASAHANAFPLWSSWSPWSYRAFASTTERAPRVQRSLKQFYRHVHPDLFSASEWHKEKAVNERSFQALREYLAHFDHDNNKRQQHMEEAHVTFYLKSAEQSAGALRKVSAVLKTPAPNVTPMWRERHLAHSLHRLYRACGVHTDLDHLGSESEPEAESEAQHEFTFDFDSDLDARRSEQGTRLVDALLQHSNLSRRIIHTRYEEERRVELAQTLFYLQEKLRVYWQMPSSSASEGSALSLSATLRLKFELLHRLQLALTLHKQKLTPGAASATALQNATVVLSNLRGADPLGRIRLHVDDTPQAWAEVLGRYDPSIQALKKGGSSAREQLEATAAKRLGIAYFYSDYTLSNTPEYLAFLSRIVESALLQPLPGLSELKVRVMSAVPSEGDASTCTLHVDVSVPVSSLMSQLSSRGPSLVAAHALLVSESLELAELMLAVKRRFRLRGLTQSRSLSNAEFHESLTRLQAHAPRLKSLLDGVKLHVARGDYALNEDDGVLTIPWDFAV